MAPFGVLCGAVAAALTPFGSLLGPLGEPSELPWAARHAGGRVVRPHPDLQQTQPKQQKHSSKKNYCFG